MPRRRNTGVSEGSVASAGVPEPPDPLDDDDDDDEEGVDVPIRSGNQAGDRTLAPDDDATAPGPETGSGSASGTSTVNTVTSPERTLCSARHRVVDPVPALRLRHALLDQTVPAAAVGADECPRRWQTVAAARPGRRSQPPLASAFARDTGVSPGAESPVVVRKSRRRWSIGSEQPSMLERDATTVEVVSPRVVAKLQALFARQQVSKCFAAWKHYVMRRKLMVQRDLLQQRNAEIERLYAEVDEGADKLGAHLKRRGISRTFHQISSLMIGACLLALVYYNWIMVLPYWKSVLFSALLAVLLAPVKDVMVSTILQLDEVFGYYRTHFAMVILVVYCFTGVFTGHTAWLVGAGVLVLWLPLILMDRDTLVSLILVIALVFMICFPTFLFVKTGLGESRDATGRLIAYIESNPEIQHLVADYEKSALFAQLKDYAQSWGWDVSQLQLDNLRQQAIAAVRWIGANLDSVFNTAFNLIGNVGDLIFQLVIFLSCLFYFLKSYDWIKSQIASLSPFSRDDNVKLWFTINQSVSRLFLCSAAIGIVHVVVTYWSFHAVGMEFPFIFSLISGFFAIMPVISSWIIWVPATVVLYAQARYMDAVFLAAVHLLTSNVIDSAIYSFIPGANSYFTGMSIVAGISAFGLVGALIGPLITATSITFYEIYCGYQRESIASQVFRARSAADPRRRVVRRSTASSFTLY